MTAKETKEWTMAQVKEELRRVAHIGEIFVDGDLCRNLWQSDSQAFMKGDDMNYNAEVGVPVKKTLLRLERTGPFPCSCALWRQRTDMPGSGEALLFGSQGSPYSDGKPSNKNYVPPKMTREMEKVFKKGKPAVSVNSVGRGFYGLKSTGISVRVSDVKQPLTVHVFVPVKDSMGEIAAALEVFVLATSD